MVVAELLKWKPPAVLVLILVMMGLSPALVQSPSLQNDFVEVFAGDAAVTLACWNKGLVGSCHDIRYTSLMDLSTTHGFLLLDCTLLSFTQSCAPGITVHLEQSSLHFRNCIASYIASSSRGWS